MNDIIYGLVFRDENYDNKTFLGKFDENNTIKKFKIIKTKNEVKYKNKYKDLALSEFAIVIVNNIDQEKFTLDYLYTFEISKDKEKISDVLSKLMFPSEFTDGIFKLIFTKIKKQMSIFINEENNGKDN